MKKETRQLVVYWLAIVTTVVSALTLFALVGAEAYVRWALNQNFSFLSGNGLAGLALLVAAQVVALLCSQKS